MTDLYIWGRGYSTQGKDGKEGQPDDAPHVIQKPKHINFVRSVRQVSFGADHVAAVTESGDLYTWGKGEKGKLGHGDETDKRSPLLVADLKSKTIRLASCGASHTACITDSGEVYTWGWDRYGQLGQNDDKPQHNLPMHLTDMTGKCVRQVVCSDNFSVALTGRGEIYTWGSGEFGRLGYGDTLQQKSPRFVEALKGKVILQVACGRYHMAALTDTGDVYSWGYGSYGQLGHGGARNQEPTPGLVEMLQGKRVRQIACGANHTVVLTDEGDVYSWGGSGDGQLGHGDKKKLVKPKAVQALAGKNISSVACGHRHTAALTADGCLYTWGYGSHGRLGHNSASDEIEPRVVSNTEGDIQYGRVECGTDHTIALTGAPISSEYDADSFHVEAETELDDDLREVVSEFEGRIEHVADKEEICSIADDIKSKLLADIAEVEQQVALAETERDRVVSRTLAHKEAVSKDTTALEQELENARGHRHKALEGVLKRNEDMAQSVRELKVKLNAEMARNANAMGAAQQPSFAARKLLFDLFDLQAKLRNSDMTGSDGDDDTSPMKLLERSSESVDALLVEARRLAKGDERDRNPDFTRERAANMLLFNANQRRKINDYAEALVMTKMNEMEEYSEKFWSAGSEGEEIEDQRKKTKKEAENDKVFKKLKTIVSFKSPLSSKPAINRTTSFVFKRRSTIVP
eukprot:GFYU01006672.1.p1 GENE.GFYU01006672.1~~GFYU01006672.1.p1  ORF type:complete len:690 (+),score=188.72 GFYU01006672.1:180-2249(+)